jgi:hypothetical protein
MPASTMVTRCPPSRTVTLRSSSSPTISTSLVRRSKRFMLTVPDARTTRSGSMRVTRPIGTKIRCRCATSITNPSTRGGWRSARSIVTASRTLPSWSPDGSNTSMPASRATKTRSEVLTGRG